HQPVVSGDRGEVRRQGPLDRDQRRAADRSADERGTGSVADGPVPLPQAELLVGRQAVKNRTPTVLTDPGVAATQPAHRTSKALSATRRSTILRINPRFAQNHRL